MLKWLSAVFPFFCSAATLQGSFYDFNLENFEIKEKPKVLVLVNIASKCGLVGQLGDLETLYKKYKDRGLLIVGIPSADFLGQEPLDSKDVSQFCQINYGVTFPIVKKSVVRGPQALEIYQWLSNVCAPKWNYHKYIFDAQGHFVEQFWPTTSPLSERFEQQIVKVLQNQES